MASPSSTTPCAIFDGSGCTIHDTPAPPLDGSSRFLQTPTRPSPACNVITSNLSQKYGWKSWCGEHNQSLASIKLAIICSGFCMWFRLSGGVLRVCVFSLSHVVDAQRGVESHRRGIQGHLLRAKTTRQEIDPKYSGGWARWLIVVKYMYCAECVQSPSLLEMRRSHCHHRGRSYRRP